eukprot:COSAG01_NODE_9326_length_2483_cov_2.095638_3_plen_124_part_00
MQVGGGEHGLRLAPSQESEADSFATDAGFEAERARLAAEAEAPPPKDAPAVAARRGKFDTRCPTGHQIPRTPVLTAAAAAPAMNGLPPRAVAAPAVAVRQAFPSFAVPLWLRFTYVTPVPVTK